MKDVTLVGPHTDYDGKLRVKGEVVSMSDTDAEWYTGAVLEQRNAALQQPMIAAMANAATPAAPADLSAHPDVRTNVASTQRDDWTPDGVSRTLKTGDLTEEEADAQAQANLDSTNLQRTAERDRTATSDATELSR